MDDLRRRFGALDSVSVPDLWPDIERRASKWAGATARPVSARQNQPRRIALTPALALVVVGLILGALIGVFVVGGGPSGVVPTGSPAPSGTPQLPFDCSAAQVIAKIYANSWDARSAVPGVSPRASWIAAWASDEVPQLVLVNPISGQTCPLVAFDDYRIPAHSARPGGGPRDWVPPRGALAFSPDGTALAFVVVGQAGDALYVLSPKGLVGPMAQTEGSGQRFGTLSWVADGSAVAVGGPGASVWVAREDGAVSKLTIDCGNCGVRELFWSPSGSQIAAQVDGGIYIGSPGATTLQAIPSTGTLAGWQDANTLRTLDANGHTILVPLAAPNARVDLGPSGLVPGVSVVVAPDGKRATQRVETSPDHAELIVTDLATGTSTTIVRDIPTWGEVFWSPDGTTIGYVIDERVPGQGLWLVNADGTDPHYLSSEPLLLAGIDVLPGWTQNSVWQPRY